MTRFVVTLALLAATGCHDIPSDRYGIARLRFEGVDEMDARALAACLATREREREVVALGVPGDPTCGAPPFDANRVELRLWTWPWADWPLFDQSLFEQDLARVIRWYRARGYPNARVVETRITPEDANESDIIDARTTCDRDDDDEGCRVRITIVVEEGEPILVRTISIVSADETSLETELQEDLADEVAIDVEDRFDEYHYEAGKEALRTTLAELGHCQATVEGTVEITRGALRADIAYRVHAGPICHVGAITVEGNEDLPTGPIVRASALRTGALYRPSALRDAQQAVFALGAFATAEVEAEGEDVVVPIVIRVTPAQRNRFLLGGGIQTGQELSTTDADAQSPKQWDIHLLGRWENRNLFGGMRRFAIEDRVRLISNEQFPRFDGLAPDRNLGNILTLEFEQPAFIEARTSLHVTSLYDVGPDPYEGFFRHALRAGIDVDRPFFMRRLRLGVGIHTAAYFVPGSPESTNDSAQDWLVTYWQQEAELDLRDQPTRTRQGVYVGLRMQEAGYGLPGSWDYLRILPEVRAFAPLPAGIVVAARFRLGAMFVRDDFGDDVAVDNPIRLGPDIHRFRGGGPVSNRGFLAQRLGDGEAGGIRLWEASVELRVPINDNLYVAGFTDMGDVSRGTSFRFDHLQTSVGAGIRYYTIVGPIRLDVGFRVPGAQVIGTDTRFVGYCTDDAMNTIDCVGDRYRGRIFGGPPGAIHITLGDSF